MNVSLSPETQQLLEEQMKAGRFSDPDEVLKLALRTLNQLRGEDYEDLDPETRAAIEEAEAEYQRGEGRPWDQVREEILARFSLKK
jgi:Arc/MetJ-type ribon-helix-helix transcriptional regulator